MLVLFINFLTSGETPFYHVLVTHVHHILQQMEEMLPQSTNWVLNEALSHNKLRQGGTLRNTLIRKIDAVIIPILALVTSFIDQYRNIALYSKNNLSPVSHVWLSLFRDTTVVRLSYEDIQRSKGYFTIIGTAQFECQFPFFWLVKEVLEEIIAGTVV